MVLRLFGPSEIFCIEKLQGAETSQPTGGGGCVNENFQPAELRSIPDKIGRHFILGLELDGHFLPAPHCFIMVIS